jgi:hypothetical protein
LILSVNWNIKLQFFISVQGEIFGNRRLVFERFVIGLEQGLLLRFLCQGITGKQTIKTLLWQLLVKPGAFGFPGYHLITYLANDFGGIANHQRSGRDFLSLPDKAKCTHNAFITEFNLVHDNGVHPYEAITADGGAVNDGSVADMSAFPQ